jgi:hypothetical protein
VADTSIVADPIVGRAVSGIVPNSDQQLGANILEDTFVDIGILEQLEARNNQILFGRRGTGKSHLLRLLTARSNQVPGRAAVFVDLRRLGSAQLMANTDKPLSVRSVSVFRDLLGELQSHLLDLATDPRHPGRLEALESVSALADTIASVSSRVGSREITREVGSSSGKTTELSATVSGAPAVGAKLGADQSRSAKYAEHYNEVIEDTIIFAEIAGALERVLVTLEITSLLLVLDEWISIPTDVQPYVAEFLKRGLLPTSRISIKIASLAYGANFMINSGGRGRIGFSFGGEISRSIDLDENYGYERNAALAEATFTELLFRHLMANFADKHYLTHRYGINDAQSLRRALFAGEDTFWQLLRAAGGVPRDFLNIFTSAYYRAAISRAESISTDSIVDAARAAFTSEKLLNLDSEQERVLTSVARALEARSGRLLFTLDRDYLKHPLIQSLYDMRVMRVVQPHYPGPAGGQNPAALFSLDYGASLTLTSLGPGPVANEAVPDLTDLLASQAPAPGTTI